MLNSYAVYPEGLYDLTLVTDDFIIYSSTRWDRDPSYMSKIIQRTQELQSSNQELGHFIITGIRDAQIVNMTEFEIVRQRFEAAAGGYNYYVNLYEEHIVDAPGIYARHQIEMFIERHLLMSQAYLELLNTIDFITDFLHDVTLAWGELQKSKSAYSNYIKDQSIRRVSVASVFTSDEFVEQIGSLRQFYDEISTISMDTISRLDIYKQRNFELWKAMVDERSLFQFYQALHDDVFNASSQTNSTILRVFSDFVGQNETWLLNNWEELHVQLNADFAHLPHTHSYAELPDDMIIATQAFEFSDIIGQVDDQYFDLINEIQDYMQGFLQGNVIDETFYK